MTKNRQFLWLEGVFDDNTVHTFKSISAASNFWQKGFLETLRDSGSTIEVIGYPAERIWPFGRLLVRKSQATLLSDFQGSASGYVNLPALRDLTQYINLRDAVLSRIQQPGGRPDYAVVFSCLEHAEEDPPSIRMARHLRKHHGVPWICIVADGATPAGADRYIYLPWSNFQSAQSPQQCIHLDGGIAEINREVIPTVQQRSDQNQKVLMYMGALTEHGGVTQLARAFTQILDDSIELWICGRGKNPGLEQIARKDPRIKVKGFVNTEELDRMARSVYAFVNPRPKSFAPNKLNYPSKLLHYLAYGKPVISTFTEGMSPDYAEILVRVEDETESALVNSICNTLAFDQNAYNDLCQKIECFNQKHTWKYQTDRFLAWLATGPSSKID